MGFLALWKGMYQNYTNMYRYKKVYVV